MGSLKVNETTPRRDRHGMGPIARAQFFHDVLEVHFDRLFGDKEPLRDIAIPISTADVTQDVELTIRERFLADMLGEMGSDLRRNALLPRIDLPDGLKHLFGRHALQQVPLRARSQSTLDLHIACEHRQQDDPSVRGFRPDREHDVDAAGIRKAKVHIPKIRILAVDHNPLLREGLSLLIQLQPDMELVGVAASGEDAVQSFTRDRPDVTLMDLDLPSGAGISAIQAILKIDPAAYVLGLLTYEWDESRTEALRAGARMCITKDRLNEDLVSLVRDCARRD